MKTVHYSPLDKSIPIQNYRLGDEDGELMLCFDTIYDPDDHNEKIVYIKIKGEVLITKDLCVMANFIIDMEMYEIGIEDDWVTICEFNNYDSAYSFAANILKEAGDINYRDN